MRERGTQPGREELRRRARARRSRAEGGTASARGGLGFGAAAQPTEYCKDLEPTGNVVLHQGDVGEYLRSETTGLI